MRKWIPNADPLRPDVWFDLQNMIPTDRGSYRTPLTTASKGYAGPATPGTTLRAWCGTLVSGTSVGYVGTTTKLYTFTSGGTYTDKSRGGGYTNTATDWSFLQYGNITLAANNVDAMQFRDASGATAFANLAAAPICKIIVGQANAVVAFNLSTGSNYWAASDVGDYTNWSTGEYATATILPRPGSINAAVALGEDIIVFKADSVYRMSYVGGLVKWTVQLIADGIGCNTAHDVVSCGDKIIFMGDHGVHIFDGSRFKDISLNPNLDLGSSLASLYWPKTETVWFNTSTNIYAYNIKSDAWGQFRFYDAAGGGVRAAPYVIVTGSPSSRKNVLGGNFEFNGATPAVYLIDVAAATTTSMLWTTSEWIASGQTAYLSCVVGEDTQDSTYSRVTPAFMGWGGIHLFDLSSSPGYTLAVSSRPTPLSPETAAAFSPVTTSPLPYPRFDFQMTARFASLKFQATTYAVDIKDLIVEAKPAGAI